MMRQRGILPRQVQLWRKQSSSPVRHSATACWDHLCAHKTQKSLNIVSLFKKEIRDKSMVKIDHLFIPLSSAPRFPCLTLPTPSQAHEEIIVGHVLACWAIPAVSLFFKKKFSHRHYHRKYELSSSNKSEMRSLSVSKKIHLAGMGGHIMEIGPTCLTSCKADTPTSCRGGGKPPCFQKPYSCCIYSSISNQ